MLAYARRLLIIFSRKMQYPNRFPKPPEYSLQSNELFSKSSLRSKNFVQQFPTPPTYFGAMQTQLSKEFQNASQPPGMHQNLASFSRADDTSLGFSSRKRVLSAEGDTSNEIVSSDNKSNCFPSGQESDPVYISSEESDTEEFGHRPNQLKVVPGFSLNGREWEDVAQQQLSAQSPSDSVKFSVMSYNILSQKLLLDNVYLYRTCVPEHLEESSRIKGIMEELVQASPDVLCLQEVEANLYFETLKPHFQERGYCSLYKKRTGTKPDGCAMFVNSNKFEIVSSREIEYYSQSVDILDRDNVAIVAVLQVKNGEKHPPKGQTPARLVIANTHLLFNQRRGDIKLAQLQYLLGEIDRMAFFGVDVTSMSNRIVVYYPVIFCGDLNLEPHSHLYEFIAKGTLRYEGLSRAYLSGQSTSFSPSSMMPRGLLPDSFGLADNSEFTDLAEIKGAMKSTVNPISGGPIVANVDKDVIQQVNSSDECQIRRYYSGVVSHPFLFRPVYDFDTRRRGDFTSLTRGSVHTVDHMFYSVIKPSDTHQSHLLFREGRLRLLRRLRVPVASVIRKHITSSSPSLPAESIPSDHVPLLAEFLLEIPRAMTDTKPFKPSSL